jgi:hypothetical protein
MLSFYKMTHPKSSQPSLQKSIFLSIPYLPQNDSLYLKDLLKKLFFFPYSLNQFEKQYSLKKRKKKYSILIDNKKKK